MDFTFFAPRFPASAHRDRLWDYCSGRWRGFFPDAPIVTGAGPQQSFCRAKALNEAADCDWQTGVFIDADVTVTMPTQVEQAAQLAHDTGSLVFAHEWRAALTQGSTNQLLDGTLAGVEPSWAEMEHWGPNTFSSCFAIGRALWDRVGGFDERFYNWGLEDIAFMRACMVLGGVERAPGVIYHLWHPRDPLEGKPQPPDKLALFGEYQSAATPGAMRKVLAG